MLLFGGDLHSHRVQLMIPPVGAVGANGAVVECTLPGQKTAPALDPRPGIVSAVLRRSGRFLRGDAGRRTLGDERRTSLLAGEVALSHSPYIGLDAPHEQEHADRQGYGNQKRQESLHRSHLAIIVPQELLI